jgi:phasin family protein
MVDQSPNHSAPKAEEPKAPAASTPAPAVKAAAAPKAPAKAKAPARRKPAARKAKRAVRAAPAKKAVRIAAAKAPAAAEKAATRIVRETRNLQNEGTAKMKNEANKIADRVQAAFGEVNDRARTAIDRNTRIAEELTELGRGNVEAIVASTRIAAKGLESVGQGVAEYSRKSFEGASAALKSFAEVKSPTDFFRLQSEFARAQFDSFVAETSKLSETMVKVAGDAAEPLTSRYSVAAEKAKAVAAF